MNNKKKIVLIFFLIFLFYVNIINVYATDNLINSMNPYTDSSDPTSGNNSLLAIVSRIFTIIQFAGTGLSIIAVMKLGISYMFSSIEEKAEIKKRAVPILIGSFIIVATVNILKIIQKIVEDSL